MQEKIFQTITSLISQKGMATPEEVSMTSNFTEDLRYDSLDLVEMVMEIEKEFNLTIPDEYVEEIETVGQLVVYIENRLEQIGVSNK